MKKRFRKQRPNGGRTKKEKEKRTPRKKEKEKKKKEKESFVVLVSLSIILSRACVLWLSYGELGAETRRKGSASIPV